MICDAGKPHQDAVVSNFRPLVFIFFGNEDLWYELLQPGGKDNGPQWLQDLTATRLVFDQGMRMLCNHGLVEAHSVSSQNGAESNGYSVHGCVHSWMVYVLNAPNEKGLAELAMKCTSLHVPGQQVAEYWLIGRRLLPHADRCRQLLSGSENKGSNTWTAASLGFLYADQGRHQEAEAMYNRALQGYEKAWGPEHTSTLDTVNNLGSLYKDQGRHQEAEAMYNRALQGKEKALGQDGVVTYVPFLNVGE